MGITKGAWIGGILTILAILGVVFLESPGDTGLATGLYWSGGDYGRWLYDLDSNLTSQGIDIVVSTVLKGSANNMDDSHIQWLYLVYFDGNYMGYQTRWEPHKKLAEVFKNSFHYSWSYLKPGWHTITLKVYTPGIVKDYRDTIGVNVPNPSCPSGFYYIKPSHYRHYIEREWYSKIPCTGFQEGIDPYPTMNSINGANFTQKTLRVYIDDPTCPSICKGNSLLTKGDYVNGGCKYIKTNCKYGCDSVKGQCLANKLPLYTGIVLLFGLFGFAMWLRHRNKKT